MRKMIAKFKEIFAVVMVLAVVMATLFVPAFPGGRSKEVYAENTTAWIEIYREFLEGKKYLSMGQDYGSETTVVGRFYDMDQDAIPELILDNGCSGRSLRAAYIYSCVSGEVKYLGIGPSDAYYVVEDGRFSELYGYYSDSGYLSRYTKNGVNISTDLFQEYSNSDFYDDSRYSFIPRKYLFELINELSLYSALAAVPEYMFSMPYTVMQWETLFTQFDFCSASSEYDPDDIDSTDPRIMRQICMHPSVASIYGQNIDSSWGNDGRKDPQGKYDAYFAIKEDWVETVAKEIYNISDADYERLLSDLLVNDCYRDGGWLYSYMGGVGGPAYVNDYEAVGYDGEYFYVTYSSYIDTGDDPLSNEAESGPRTYQLKEKEINGKPYWSIYSVEKGIVTLKDPEQLKTGMTETIDYPSGSVKVTLDEKMFMQNNKEYHKDISTLAVALSMAAYDEGDDNLGKGLYLYEAYRKLGFLSKDIALYSYPDNPNGLNKRFDNRFQDKDMAFSIASRKLDEYTLVIVDFRGTSSNMDKIKDVSIFKKKRNFYGRENAYASFVEFWEDYNIAMNDYWFSHEDLRKAGEEGKTILLITGHSLGAAAANLAGKAANMGNSGIEVDADKVFVYTYACPNVSNDVTADNNIFNIINDKDIVPDLPMGLTRYGKDLHFKSSDSYGFDGHNFDRYVNAVVNDQSEAAKKKPLGKKLNYFTTHCPVNMEVRKGDKLIGRVVNNTIVDAVDEGYFYVEGDRKMFIAPDDDTYEIKLTAYEDGEMDVIIGSSDGEVIDQKNYLSVKLKNGDEFTTEFGKPSVVAKSEINVKHTDGSTEMIKASEFQETKISSGNDKRSNVIWLIISIAAAVILFVVILFLIVRRKGKKLKITKPVGTKMISYAPQPQQFESRFCAKCGSTLDSEQLYCGVCGTKRV